MKDHVFLELVNDLRDIAKQYHGHDSLRDRISGRLRQDVTPDEVCRTSLPIAFGWVDATTGTDKFGYAPENEVPGSVFPVFAQGEMR